MNIFKKIKSFFIPKIEKTKVSIKDLKSKSKKELEKIGRKLGVELDRRLSKSKLIKKIQKLNK
tara:strand:- start:75 stop:263 length:189 start_codon:yes stop_codon:yes gene_type:complete